MMFGAVEKGGVEFGFREEVNECLFDHTTSSFRFSGVSASKVGILVFCIG
jgi:hypothetical protein